MDRVDSVTDSSFLEPVCFFELLGPVIWNGKNRLIFLRKRVMDCIPDLKDRRKIVLYKMEIFLSRKEYATKVKKILEGKEPIPIHIYFEKENDKQ